MSNIIVTTGDLHKDYQVLGPVYFQVSNKGLFSSALGKLKENINWKFNPQRSPEQCHRIKQIGVSCMENGP